MGSKSRGLFVLAFALLVTRSAAAEEKEKLDPERHELAGFPIIGGNTDIGVQFGGAATLTRFHDDLEPYLWNIDLLLSASLKNDSNGTRLVQQSHVLRLDAPSLFDKKVRLDIRGSFQRTVNAGYYGIGNATEAAKGATGRRYQYLQQEGRARLIGRYHTGTPVDFAYGTNLRYEAPSAYAKSQLLADRGQPESTALGGIAAGIMIDKRDSEFVTQRGFFYQFGAGYTIGSNNVARYANTSAVMAHYAPLVGPLIFAQRFVASFEVGRIPFYDQQQGGTFEPQNLLGGETGIRGVPQGRYAGAIKAITNVEIRSTFPRFTLFKQRFRIGTTAFFDAGRVWADYRLDPQRDGTKLGLKFGVGGGLFLQWGLAAIFRVEAAYSPDAIAENPSFPVGIYVSDGLMF
jgi:outer membrane protein assembly factor BamA